jgi:SH3-like domain-containing protein
MRACGFAEGVQSWRNEEETSGARKLLVTIWLRSVVALILYYKGGEMSTMRILARLKSTR